MERPDLRKTPTGRNDYLKVKSLFVRKILGLAERG